MGEEARGIALGVALDALIGDPRRGHPVALFGTAATELERRVYRDSRTRGLIFTAVCVGSVTALGVLLPKKTVITAAATWAVLGGTTLAREGANMARHLDDDDIDAARRRLPHLCGRDPSNLGEDELARATVESIAENTSDAVVAPLFWGAVAGVPGLLAYRAINTLDAMVGHHSPRYEKFGWAAARLDDVVNYIPARLTALLAALCSGRFRPTLRAVFLYGSRHPSPNSGQCEAAFAGALNVTLGGVNDYGGRLEHRPELGDGPRPTKADISRSVTLARRVAWAAAALAVLAVLARRK
ncbi:cobalamin biosynthesis protein [Herbidospora mongoliensis]|uniref:cobalamin biosynthesis protein n=1 Tax=Herbidospora mongoliensis TaxID=688067 RepID=UPI00083707F0|nr:cobalamin biosynthesis protein [Herbidospora mongoliensis]